MTILLTLTFGGTDSGPFDLYQDSDGYTVPFATAVDKAAFILGIYYEVDDTTTSIKIVSDGLCINYIDITLEDPCFKILPTNSNWILDRITGSTSTYLYGNFTGYTFGSASFTEIRLMKINSDLTLDRTFDVGTGLNAVYYTGSTIIEQPDGKIIAGGTFSAYQGVSANAIVRINTDGSRDDTFVIGSGFTGNTKYTQQIKLDSLGRIITTGLYTAYNGNPSYRLTRILPDGTFDPTLATGGGFDNTTIGVIVNADDSLIITGYFSSYNGVATSGGICKVNSDGSRDLGFLSGTGFSPAWNNNPNWPIQTPGESSFYVFGYFTTYQGVAEKYIIKINSDGTKDTSFDNSIGFNGTVSAGNIIWDNKIILFGDFTTYKNIPTYYSVILNPDGSIFRTFNAFEEAEGDIFVIGNDLFCSVTGECIIKIDTYVPPATTTTTTTTL